MAADRGDSSKMQKTFAVNLEIEDIEGRKTWIAKFELEERKTNITIKSYGTR